MAKRRAVHPVEKDSTAETRVFQHLRSWRKRRALTVINVANALGVDHSTVSRWETGKVNLSARDLGHLSALFACTPADLMSEPPETSGLASQCCQAGVHKHLRDWRKSKGLTQELLGQMIGLKESTISGWESGARQVGLDDLGRIAKAYGCAPEDLLRPPSRLPQTCRDRMALEIASSLPAEVAEEWLAVGRRLAQLARVRS